MGKKKEPTPKPPRKDVSTDVDPIIHYKLKNIAAQQNIPLNELMRRILTYYANAYMPSTPVPPLPQALTTMPVTDQTPYANVMSNGNGIFS